MPHYLLFLMHMRSTWEAQRLKHALVSTIHHFRTSDSDINFSVTIYSNNLRIRGIYVVGESWICIKVSLELIFAPVLF